VFRWALEENLCDNGFVNLIAIFGPGSDSIRRENAAEAVGEHE
jgi:hypothetical protein